MNKRSSSQGYARILDAAARDHIPSDLNLAPQIIARIQKGKGASMQPRIKFISAVLLALIAFAVLFYAVPGVAAAIQRWFGYVPGIGLVSEGSIRVLAEPVTVTREGMSITVEQVVLNLERTALVYTAEGIPSEANAIDPREHCPYKVDLYLPDGTRVAYDTSASWYGTDTWPTGYTHHFNFEPIPAAVNDAVLKVACLFPARTGAAPENWEIPLHFVPAPPDMTAFPVIEIATPTVEEKAVAPEAGAPEAGAPEAGAAQTATPAPLENAPTETTAAATDLSAASTITLTFDRAVQMDDGYLLYAVLHWEKTPFSVVDVGPMRLLDASGKEMVFEFIYDDQSGLKVEQRQTILTIKTEPVKEPGPLTLEMDAVSIELPVQDVTFSFDPGKDPKPGQVWRIDQVLQIGEHSLNVHTARATETGYVFEMSSDTGIMYAMLADFEHPVAAGGGGGGGGDLGQKFENGIYYITQVSEPITVHVAGISLQHSMDLHATWTPPAVSTNLLPTQTSSCLNAAAWQAAKGQQVAIPEGLGGKLLVSGPLEDKPGEYGAWISSLDGAEKQVLPGAQDGAFSPDGATLAYSTLKDGITLLDLASGQSAPLPGTSGGDFNPLWSPDGKAIVFNRGQGIFDLFMVNLDGSNMRKLTSQKGQEWASGWLADGQLIYILPGRENEYITYRVDVQSGETALYEEGNVASVAPQGQYLLTTEKVFGDRWRTYLSAPDGSNRWLLASDELWVMTPQWSPDGQWLLAAVSDTTSDATTGALINPRTCQVIAVPGLKGSFLSWTE